MPRFYLRQSMILREENGRTYGYWTTDRQRACFGPFVNPQVIWALDRDIRRNDTCNGSPDTQLLYIDAVSLLSDDGKEVTEQ